MEFKEIKTWVISPDHKARPKNPYPLSESNGWPFNSFEQQAKEHIYHCSPSLVAGEYPAEDVELVWQQCMAYDELLQPIESGWQICSMEDAERDNKKGWSTRQYLQLKQPVQSKEWSSESIEADIYSAIAHGLSDVITDRNITSDITISVENVIDVLKLRKLI